MLTPYQTTPLFHVRELARALRHYQEVMGFSVEFTWGRRRSLPGCGWGRR
jgi:hypothetical protein